MHDFEEAISKKKKKKQKTTLRLKVDSVSTPSRSTPFLCPQTTSFMSQMVQRRESCMGNGQMLDAATQNAENYGLTLSNTSEHG